MATTVITKTNWPDTGFNVIDGTYATLSTGSGNGVEFTYDPSAMVFLRNGTGGDATFSILVPTPAQFAAKGVTVPADTVVVPTGDTIVYPMSPIYKQAAGTVKIECDVAGEVLVLGK